MAASESSPKGDYSLIAPVGLVTSAIHAFLGRFFRLIVRYPWPALALVGFLYLVGIVLINVPMLDIDRGTSAMVVLSPLLILTWGAVAYMAIALILLSFFARCDSTRLSFAALLVLLFLGPLLILAMGDTRLLLIIGDSYLLVVAHLVLTTSLFIRARDWFMRHARWSTPALLLLAGLIGFESRGYFYTTEIPRNQFSLHNCETIKAPPGKPDYGPPLRVCDVDLQFNGFEYGFRSMTMPDSRVKGMRVRHALFDHFRLH